MEILGLRWLRGRDVSIWLGKDGTVESSFSEPFELVIPSLGMHSKDIFEMQDSLMTRRLQYCLLAGQETSDAVVFQRHIVKR